jgi:hypothetical protein
MTSWCLECGGDFDVLFDGDWLVFGLFMVFDCWIVSMMIAVGMRVRRFFLWIDIES